MGLFDWLFGKKADSTCRKCGRSVKGTTHPKLDWYDADQVDWHCSDCRATFCGECSTAKLQQLKQKYGATGVSLKTAINNDPMALYEHWELAPHCPGCKKRTWEVAGSQDATRSRDAKRTSKKPNRERAKVLNDEGIAAAQRGDTELATQKLRAAIDEDPTWGVPCNNLGTL